MKKFISGILVGVIIMTSTLVFAETNQTINAIFGRVKLVVDGAPVDKETLLYNGTTYVPLRAAAEALGKEVSYDDATKTAYIGSSQVSIQPIAQAEPVQTALPQTSVFILGAGDYVVGEDIEVGKYNLKAISGTGNFSVYRKDAKPLMGKVYPEIAMMFGKDDNTDYYTETYENLRVETRDKIEIRHDVKIEFTKLN